MGVIRLYLALCVIAAHSTVILPWGMHTGREAVQIFFIISGFYMALIQQKYTSSREFFASRFLRIFIPYWCLLILIIGVCTISGLLFHAWGVLTPYVEYSRERNGLGGVFFTAVSNVTLFFQDTVMFCSHDAGERFRFTTAFGTSYFPLWRYLVMPLAWSVGVELSFYLLVPILAKRRTRTLVLVMLGSIVLRVYAYECLGLTNDPWTYRFFPFELLLFVAGMVSYRLYATYKEQAARCFNKWQLNSPKRYATYILFALIMFWVANEGQRTLAVWVGDRYATLISYIGWATVIPMCFAVSKDNSVDRLIGELSYPVYLVHVFAIHTIGLLTKHCGLGKTVDGLLAAIGSFIGAILVMTVIVAPLEKRRVILARLIAEKRFHLRAIRQYFRAYRTS